MDCKGFHFNPSEIENEIQSMDGVEMVSVVGLHDLYLETLTVAAIVKTKGSKLTAEEVIQSIASKFPDYKHLHGGVYFFDKLPMTLTGKIIKRRVREEIIKLKEIH